MRAIARKYERDTSENTLAWVNKPVTYCDNVKSDKRYLLVCHARECLNVTEHCFAPRCLGREKTVHSQELCQEKWIELERELAGSTTRGGGIILVSLIK